MLRSPCLSIDTRQNISCSQDIKRPRVKLLVASHPSRNVGWQHRQELTGWILIGSGTRMQYQRSCGQQQDSSPETKVLHICRLLAGNRLITRWAAYRHASDTKKMTLQI